LDRVAIRGWSFGGYLAALAALDRPDVFHAASAGAPVTDSPLYDTHYTERYPRDPTTADGAAVSDANPLLTRADRLTRPLPLTHGLADDNVVAAHTLQLSSALLAAGRPHEVLPLVGVTHMTSQEVVAENLLLHQLDFLRRALPGGDDTAPVALPTPPAADPLAEIYRGVAVTANANDERLAALDLLALVVAADARLDPAELATLTAISLDWQVEGFTERTFDEYL